MLSAIRHAFVGDSKTSKTRGIGSKMKRTRPKKRKGRILKGRVLTDPTVTELMNEKYKILDDMYSAVLEKSKNLEIEEKRLKDELRDITSDQHSLKNDRATLNRTVTRLQTEMIDIKTKEKHHHRDMSILEKELGELKQKKNKVTVDETNNGVDKDDDDDSMLSLAKMFAKFFHTDNMQVHNRKIDRASGNVVIYGVSEWFRFIVKETFYDLNRKLKGALNHYTVDTFVIAMMKADLGDSLCEFVRDCQVYKECRFKNMTGKDRKAVESHYRQSYIRFMGKLTTIKVDRPRVVRQNELHV